MDITYLTPGGTTRGIFLPGLRERIIISEARALHRAVRGSNLRPLGGRAILLEK
jgi:hypothetical protein